MALKIPCWIEAMQGRASTIPVNKKFEFSGFTIWKKGYTQEVREFDYDEVFAPVTRIAAIRQFLAISSIKVNFVVYPKDEKSVLSLWEDIKKKLILCQPPDLKDSSGCSYVKDNMVSLRYLTITKTISCLKCVPVNLKSSHLHSCEQDFKIWDNMALQETEVVANFTTEAEYFWSFVVAKTINGEVQLHALVDGKRIVITKTSVRRTLRLADAEGIDCFLNSTIFENHALMGYEKISEKLTFYKAFFSPQWKFLIHTILQCLSPKTTAWNEFSNTMASAMNCLQQPKV
ncbi:copia protein [Tanacetum coccineum]